MTKIYGHRGSKGEYPENTILSIKKALEAGAEGIELDVHLTKDGEFIVHHDATLDRTTTGTGFVKDYTLAEIKQLSVGAKFSNFEKYEPTWDFEGVPTLYDVLEIIEVAKVELNIELKTYEVAYPRIEEKILQAVKNVGFTQKVVYSSFHLPTILRLQKLDKTAEIAWLSEYPLYHFPADYVESLGIWGLHMDKDIVLENPHIWANMASRLRVWTVNEEDKMRALLKMGVASIITDYPERAIKIRNSMNSK